MDSVVGANQEIGSDAHKFVRGGQHQLAYTLPVRAVNAFHVLGE